MMELQKLIFTGGSFDAVAKHVSTKKRTGSSIGYLQEKDAQAKK